MFWKVKMDFLSLNGGSKRGYRNLEQFHGQQGGFDVVATLRPKLALK